MYLNKLLCYIGHPPKNMIVGKYIDTYFYKNILKGSSFTKNILQIKDILKDETTFFTFNTKKNTNNFINNISILLQNHIFLYDFNKRINISELIQKFKNY